MSTRPWSGACGCVCGVGAGGVTVGAAGPRGLVQPVVDTKRPTRVLGASEADDTRGLDNQGVLHLQQEKMRRTGTHPRARGSAGGGARAHAAPASEQDASLDQLHQSVTRIKHVAVAVSQELDEQKRTARDVADDGYARL
jgi:hypothetical protein